MLDRVTTEGLQREVDAIAWYHDFDFPNGLTARSKTADADSHRRLWRFIEAELGQIAFGRPLGLTGTIRAFEPETPPGSRPA
jgi:hypothetical protein